MKKMGWKPGQGLGKNQDGSLTPLLLDVKMDKKGLVSEDERPGGKKQAPVTLTNVKDVSGECGLVERDQEIAEMVAWCEIADRSVFSMWLNSVYPFFRRQTSDLGPDGAVYEAQVGPAGLPALHGPRTGAQQTLPLQGNITRADVALGSDSVSVILVCMLAGLINYYSMLICRYL